MGTSGHAARTQSDGTATKDGRMVPGLLTTTLGRRLPAWAHASRRDPRTRLCGRLLTLAKFLSPGRQPPAKTTTVSTEAVALEETPTAPASRQISPQVSAALLSKFRTQLTPE